MFQLCFSCVKMYFILPFLLFDVTKACYKMYWYLVTMHLIKLNLSENPLTFSGSFDFTGTLDVLWNVLLVSTKLFCKVALTNPSVLFMIHCLQLRFPSLRAQLQSKCQLISECIFDILNFPKTQHQNLTNFYHRIEKVVRLKSYLFSKLVLI